MSSGQKNRKNKEISDNREMKSNGRKEEKTDQRHNQIRPINDSSNDSDWRISELQLRVIGSMLKLKCWKLFVLLAKWVLESIDQDSESATIIVDPIEILRFLSSRGLTIRSNEMDGRIIQDMLRLFRSSREFPAYLELLLSDNSPVRFSGGDFIDRALLRLLRTTGLPLMRTRQLIDDRSREQINAILAVNSRLRCTSRDRVEIVIREEDFERERELCNNNLEDNDFHYNNHRPMRRREFLGEDDLMFYVLYKMI